MNLISNSVHRLKAFCLSKEDRPLLLLAISLVTLIILGTIFFYEFNIVATGSGSGVIIAIGAISCISIIIVLGAFAILAPKNPDRALGVAFLATALITGLFFVVTFFPGSGPDEDTHFSKPYVYSNAILGVHSDVGSISMRRTDAEIYQDLDRRQSVQAYDRVKSRFHMFNEYGPDELVEVPGSVGLTDLSLLPQVRIPATIGFTIGRILNLSGLFTFYLARFLNLLSFVILAYFAIRITPFAKSLFMAIALLPMTLFICSTLSYDAGIIGMALMFIAICLKCRSLESSIPRKYLIGLFVLAVLLMPCKVVYFFLSFLVLLIPNKNFASKKTAIMLKAALILVSLASLLIFSLSGILYVSFGDNSSIIGRGEGANRFHSSSELLAYPIRNIFILGNTIFQQSDFYLLSFLGGALGTIQDEIKSPWCFIIVYALILFLAAQKNSEDKTTIGWKTKVVFAAICIAATMGVMVSMFLAFTLADEMVIYGVQGKYFLPLAPLILLIFRMNKSKLEGDPRKYILFGMFGMNQAYMLFLFEAMLRVPS